MDGPHVRLKDVVRQTASSRNSCIRRWTKVIERIQLVEIMERGDDVFQRRQIDHVATDMDEVTHRVGVCMKVEWNAETEPNVHY